MSCLPLRTMTWLVAALVVVSGVSGCFGKKRGQETTDDPSRLALSLVGWGAPEGTEEVVVNVTIDHVALFSDDGAWLDLLAAAHATELVFADGFGEPAFLADVPLPPATYTAIEIIATAATVTEGGTTTSATVASVACYSDVTLTADEGALAELELLLSGPDALQRDGATWVFRPAVVGSFAPEDADGEAAIDEPDCRAI